MAHWHISETHIVSESYTQEMLDSPKLPSMRVDVCRACASRSMDLSSVDDPPKADTWLIVVWIAWLSFSSSGSSLSGRTNTFSSESWGSRALRHWTGHAYGLVFLKSDEVWIQTRGSSPWSSRSFQWSRRQKTSLTWNLDGFFYSNPPGMHSAVIHDVGSVMREPQGMTCFLFPVIKPYSNMLSMQTGRW